jgi:hypothetical protein
MQGDLTHGIGCRTREGHHAVMWAAFDDLHVEHVRRCGLSEPGRPEQRERERENGVMILSSFVK